MNAEQKIKLYDVFEYVGAKDDKGRNIVINQRGLTSQEVSINYKTMHKEDINPNAIAKTLAHLEKLNLVQSRRLDQTYWSLTPGVTKAEFKRKIFDTADD